MPASAETTVAAPAVESSNGSEGHTTNTSTAAPAAAAAPDQSQPADHSASAEPLTAIATPPTSTPTPTTATTTANSTPSSSPSLEESTRNQAPGIPDRRKSTRPGHSARATRGIRKSAGNSKRVSSVVDMAAEMRMKADDTDNSSKTDTEKDSDTNEQTDNDTFEDATSTPRPESDEPDVDAGAADEKVKAEAGNGLGISGVDGVKEEEEADVEEASKLPPPPPDTTAPQSPPQVSPRNHSQSPSKLSSRPASPVKTTHGLSGSVALPTQPPPSTAERRQNLESRESADSVASPPPHPGFARKASSGFGALLGRMGSIRKPARSPPAARPERFGKERRNTAASQASTGGESITGHEGVKPSLQDQFANLRRQEEFSTSGSDGNTLHEQDENAGGQQASSDVAPSSPKSPRKEDGRIRSTTLDANLPPGTASGMSAGPPPEPKEVNWDLWQQLVYEGPSALSRTSGDEMNVAITAGIPAAIRGVVWQVLAESKNEELETVYRTLKARGTEAEQRHPKSRAGSSLSVRGGGTEKDGANSDASSEHSNHSTSANSGAASPPTSVDSHANELQSKLSAEKHKREAAALQKLEKAIKRDMGSRTSYSKYTQSAGLQDGLFGVCKAYALFDEGVGYAQGINFIAMPLLFNMAEEEAFTLLVRLMSKYDLRSLFTPDMRGLHLRLYQFERLLEEYEPAVYCHLKRRNVEPQLYATQWFLTLFVYRFPLQLVLRIYDLILSEGLTAILKFGIVLIQHNRQALLELKDMGQLTNFLKEKLFDVYIDKSPSASSLLDSGFFGSVTGGADKELYRADDMVRDACTIKISDATLKAYTTEWEEQQRVERERESELETLRIANASLTNKVRILEERVQQHDTEHVSMAQDLVRIKVENDALQDANEGLKEQVIELQKIVDAQPEEVESRLKAEMERIMQRNIEVQNENRNLKEEMDEMEHELVNAKMAHAQAQADHDNLKQKLTNVSALLAEKQ